MAKRIILTVSNDLNTDQRVLKISRTLQNNGYIVLVTGRILSNSQPLPSDINGKRFKCFFNRGALFYAEINIRLFVFLLFAKGDIFYANDTDTLAAAFLAAKLRSKPLVFDAHELFPEVPELQHRPFVKKCWVTLENFIIPKLKTSFTVCNSIAQYYAEKYGIQMTVIRNVPYRKTHIEGKLSAGEKKILLYQGALNVGRGLEWVIEAMPFVNNAVFYIIGDGDIREDLQQRVARLNLEEKVIFTGKISGDVLYQYTPSAAIGLCLLEANGLSYYFALPNRIFDYLHAGVPVLASPFPEIKAIVERYNTGVLTDDYRPEALAKTINKMLDKPIDTTHFERLSAQFCWEQEEKILINKIGNL